MNKKSKINIISEYKDSYAEYEKFSKKITALIQELLEQNNIQVHSLSNRVKNEKSILNKIDKKKYNDISQITDIAGVRVITYYSDDIDKIATIIEKEFTVDKKNSIDKRNLLDPDRFGYSSVHYIVSFDTQRKSLPENISYQNFNIEIQIRTILQHAWAEIEHDTGYKCTYEVPKEIRRDFSRVAGLLELADKEFVEIRNKLLLYQKDIDKQSENELNAFSINKISLMSYIDKSKVIQDINSYLLDGNNLKLEYSESTLQVNLKQLSYLGYETIADIDRDLNSYKELIILIMKRILLQDNKKYDVLCKSISVLYLGYAKIIQTYSKDKIDSYFSLQFDFEENDMEYIDIIPESYEEFEDYEDNEDYFEESVSFTDQLIAIYKEYCKGNNFN